VSVLFQHRCDLYQAAAGEGTLGSAVESRTLVQQNVKCTYAKRRERGINTGVSQLSQMMQEFMLLPADQTVQDGWFVLNVRTRRGAVIESGPFLVETLTPELHLGGHVAHQMLVLKRSYS
jgi:hypothetical protein